MTKKPILCLDFDGVIHDYKEGWKDGVIYGNVTPGFFEWAEKAHNHFKLVVYSSRSKTPEGIEAMKAWLLKQLEDSGEQWFVAFEFAHEKPPAMITIDDRAVRFDGTWADMDLETLLKFTPWNVVRAQADIAQANADDIEADVRAAYAEEVAK